MYERVFKQLLDLLLSVILIPIYMAFYIIFGVLIKIEDKGPIIFNQKRLGKNGKLFNIKKFRTMKINAPDVRNEDGSTFNSNNDVRVTRIGNFMRKTSVDEIPQIINVLKGEMSFIGPRPDLPEAINRYSDIESHKLYVKPGISGYSQAYFRNSISPNEKFRNDVIYVNNISFILDLKILCATSLILLKRGDIYTESSGKKSIKQYIDIDKSL